MALKRVLPSRLTGAQLPDSAGVPTAASVRNVSAATETPAQVASNTPAAAPAPDESQAATAAALAAAAGSAFSTLPAAAQESAVTAPARVLEESFAPAAIPVASTSAESVTPSVPVVEESTPAPQPQPVAAPIIEEKPEPAPAQAQETVPVQMPVSEVVPALPVVEEPAPVAAVTPIEQPAPAQESAPAPAPEEPVFQGPTDFLTPAAGSDAPSFTPSRPDENPFKRRVGRRGGQGGMAPAATATPAEAQVSASASAVPSAEAEAAPGARGSRVKRGRDFAAATVVKEEDAAPPANIANAGLAEHVPVESRPLSRVDEELIAAGIVKGPEKDSLTQNVPGAVAETVMDTYDAQEEPLALMPQQEIKQPAAAPVLPSLSSVSAPAAAPAATTSAGGYVSAKLKGARAEDEIPEDPEVNSALPWANPAPSGVSGAWDVDVPAAGGPAMGMPEKPIDFYKPLAPGAAAGTPPWQAGGAGAMPPPEIMGQRKPPAGAGGFPAWGMALGVAAVGVIGFMVWSNNKPSDMQAQVARLTGTLNGKVSGTEAVEATKPTGSFSMADVGSNKGALLPPAVNASSTAQIDFADVPADQTKGPIVADGSEKMPEDISVMAKWQQAVAQARAEKTGGVSATDATPAPVQAAGAQAEPLTADKLKEELDSYRRTLAEGGPVSPEQAKAQAAAQAQRKMEMNKDPDAYMDGTPLVDNGSAALLPPPSSTGQQGQSSNVLPPPELYTNNPKGLPIVAEPRASTAPPVRTLTDFEAEPFEPEREKVRIPRGLKPKMAATDFPSLEVLSFVPQKGIIAYADGREGVLLLGESISGWELTNVTGDVAEFRAGRKSHYVTAEN